MEKKDLLKTVILSSLLAKKVVLKVESSVFSPLVESFILLTEYHGYSLFALYVVEAAFPVAKSIALISH